MTCPEGAGFSSGNAGKPSDGRGLHRTVSVLRLSDPAASKMLTSKQDQSKFDDSRIVTFKSRVLEGSAKRHVPLVSSAGHRVVGNLFDHANGISRFSARQVDSGLVMNTLPPITCESVAGRFA